MWNEPSTYERLGHEWVASLSDRLPEEEESGLDREEEESDRGRSALGRFLREEVGIRQPGQESAKAALGEPHATAIPAELLRTFAEKEGHRIREFAHELEPLVNEVARAADRREAPDPARVRSKGGDGQQAAARLLRVYGPRLRPVPMRTLTGRRRWGLQFSNLAERAVTEIFELFAVTPKVRRCRHCGRVFVPNTRGQATCRAFLWETWETPPAPAIQLCVRDEVLAALQEKFDARAHDRERKRRHQQLRREINRSGANSARARRAQREYDKWISIHARRRGPKPNAMADITLDDK